MGTLTLDRVAAPARRRPESLVDLRVVGESTEWVWSEESGALEARSAQVG